MSATHGRWCNAVTWPTKCPGCRESVFFFRCDHGSGVFFDALGQPWSIHDCGTSWTRKLVRRKDESGAITVEILPGITARRPPEGTIDTSVVSIAKQREQKPDPIVVIDPDSKGEVDTVGVLRERRIDVDVEKTLKLAKASPMASGFLGPLGKGRWSRITVHTLAPRQDVLHSYTAWIPSEVLSSAGGQKGMTVSVRVSSRSIPGIGSFWICDSYEVLG